MPRYDFICRDCGSIITVERSIANRNRITNACREVQGLGEDECGGKLVRKWTPPVFRFEGGQPSHG